MAGNFNRFALGGLENFIKNGEEIYGVEGDKREVKSDVFVPSILFIPVNFFALDSDV